jgi:large subunit ribosomal protein L6
LTLNLGFSHVVEYPVPEHITIAIEKGTHLVVSGHDRQQVGQVAAQIRGYRKCEPYKGKGVKYSDETVVRKAGKAAK